MNLIVYYDDRCGFCSAVVERLGRGVPTERMALRSVWSPSGMAWARLAHLSPEDSIIVLDSAGLHVRSRAVVAILHSIGQPMRAALLQAFPRALADACYRLVGAWRYSLPGFRGLCPLPAPNAAPLVDSTAGLPIADVRALFGSDRWLRRDIDGCLSFVLPNLTFASASAPVPPGDVRRTKLLGLPPMLAALVLRRTRHI